MLSTRLFIFLFLLFSGLISAQQVNILEEEISIGRYTDGILVTPSGIQHPPLVILIQGSGPTDRNGNQPMMKSDFSKKIALELSKEGIASFRFDKRIFKMNKFNIREKDLRFEDFVEDAKEIKTFFYAQDRFSRIILAGHSEGSLIGILATDDQVDGLISLAGAGRPIDKIIVDQVAKQAPGLKENTRLALDELMSKGSTDSYNPALASIFRPEVQPFMRSWMKYDPSAEIGRLTIPILIIQGTADIQVESSEAEILYKAATESQLVLLQQMNHVFRKMEGADPLVNTKSYNEPGRPLHPELIPAMTAFINSLEQ